MSFAKFSFETDFRSGNAGRRVSDLEAQAAREAGLREGMAQGRAQAEAERDAAEMHMMGLLAEQARHLLAGHEERFAHIEQGAAALAAALAQRIAGAALARTPFALIEEAARECLQQARAAQHLSIRVHESLTERTEQIFARLAHEGGFAGKIVVLADPHLARGDARIEWADGGVAIDQERVAQAVEEAIQRVLGGPTEAFVSLEASAAKDHS